MCVPRGNKKLLEAVAYLLGAAIIIINLWRVVTWLINFSCPHVVITFLSFRAIIFTKDTKELVEPVEGTDKYRKTSSFYIYEATLEAHDQRIKLIGGISFPVIRLTAISAAIGMVGVLKKIPILVRIWAYNLAFYLGWWASWVSRST